MNDVLLAIARDLPSTAVLILFVYVTSMQYREALTLIKEHLEDISNLLAECLKRKDAP